MKSRSQRYAVLESIVLSILGIGAYNAVIQLLIYPFLSRQLGAETFGQTLTLLSVMTVPAICVGAGINYARMANVPRFDASNGDYNRCLLPGAAAVAVLCAAALFYFDAAHPASWALFPLLGVAATLRYYGSVAFRLEVNYRKNLLFYLLLSAGYALGLGLFRLTGVWETALLCGEALAVGYVTLRSPVLRRPFWTTTENARAVRRSCAALIPAQFFSNLTLHADRLLIGALLDGEQVTIFYTASLLGKAMAMLTEPIAGVAIGYLARAKRFGRREFSLCALGSLALGALCCLVFIPLSPFLIGLLYPDVAAQSAPLFLVANGGQIVYFTANLLLVIVLRFAAEKYQFYINVTYCAAFFAVCIPALLHGGLSLFCTAVLLLNALRLAAVLLLGFRKSKEVTNV
ncbi:MAG: hypothetical protein IJT44_02930 [Clostridia bacterium]|nr:hypothetical protein [Clostridia bacterium]